jgi:PKD repeat protein
LAETYFVRTDGGSADQCTGLSDAPYPGNGNGQACAWNHPFVALPPGASPRIEGGDTLMIGDGSYRMGFGAPAADNCAASWSWDCYMPPIPSGPSADQPTRILGEGHDQSCTDAPELWGTERASTVLNLDGSSNVELACLEVTDRASCIDFHCHNGQCDGQVAACDRSAAPWGDWASTGVSASDSSNVVVRDVNIHGMANQGVYAGRLTDWTMERVRINANGWAGWDGDIGSDSGNSGTMLFVDSEIAWNGCVEDWQSGDKFGCWGQGGGGYGDGLGVGESGGHWIFENADVHHNTSDGIDLLYLREEGQATVRRSRIDSNAGNQVKISRSAVIENSLVIGNCSYFADHANMHDGDVCRALGDAVYVGFSDGSRTDLINNTIIGQGNCVVSGGGGNAESVLTMGNNLIIGNPYWHSQSQQSCLYYSGSNGQVVWENNAVFDVRHDACPGDSVCDGDPGIVDASLDSFDPNPTAGSLLIAAADPSLAPDNDFNDLARGVNGGPDIGAFEYGAEAEPDPEPEPEVPEPPVAEFDVQCSDLSCTFTAQDDPGSELDFAWDFGDGDTGETVSTSHVYGASGNYTVTLTVTDTHGQSDEASQTISVSGAVIFDPVISLRVKAIERRGGPRFSRLIWHGIGDGATDIYRNGTLIAATFSYQVYGDRLEADSPNDVGYRICRHGTQHCSETIYAHF